MMMGSMAAVAGPSNSVAAASHVVRAIAVERGVVVMTTVGGCMEIAIHRGRGGAARLLSDRRCLVGLKYDYVLLCGKEWTRSSSTTEEVLLMMVSLEKPSTGDFFCRLLSVDPGTRKP